MKKTFLTIVVAALVGGITAYAVADKAISGNTQETTVPPAGGTSYRTVNLNLSDYPDFTFAAESAVDAVVFVKVTVQMRQQQVPGSIFDFFGLFGMPGQGFQGGPREQVGSGSGVIIREDGYIVTNNHVVGNASKIEVTLNNRQTYEATLVGTDPATDVAVIKIDASGLPTVPFTDSDNLRLGEWVLAIGSPYGLRSTITAGIVSAKGRSMPSNGEEMKIESFIQTDAAVNPGNSGGALVNKQGQLVGVNTAIISETGSYAGYSFAIPSNIVKKIADDLMEYGAVRRATLGVTVMEIDAKKAAELKLSSVAGVYINEVMKGSSAQKAGVKSKDVLIKVDSTVIRSFAVLQETLSKFRPGDSATLLVVRDGKNISLPITFLESDTVNGAKTAAGVAFFGATIAPASKEKLAAFGLKKGVEVVSVGPGKMQDAGAEAGFIITHVNNTEISSPQDIVEIAKKSDRAVYIEGVTATGRPSFFGFGIR